MINPLIYFDLLRKGHDDFLDLALNLRFDKTDLSQLIAVTLYGSIIELTGTCICLIKNISSIGIIGIPLVQKSILEAYVDLINIIDNSDYKHNIAAAYYKEWVKYAKEAKSGKNHYLIEVEKLSDLDKIINEYSEGKQKLIEKGHDILKIEQKFERAQFSAEYKSLYFFFCLYSHNNLGALIGRHSYNKDGNNEVVFYKEKSLKDCLLYIDINLQVLSRASLFIHKYLNSPMIDKIYDLLKIFNITQEHQD